MATFRVQDTDLHFEVVGQGRPIIFVPGLGTGGQIWAPVVSMLSDTYQCITVDTRGAGFSGTSPGPYTITLLARDVLHLQRHLALHAPTIIGHSMGGFIALTLSLQTPLHRLVLVSTSASGVPGKGGLTDQAIKAISKVSSRREVTERIAEIGLGSKSSAEERDRLVSTLLARPLRGRGYLAQQAAVTTFDMSDALHRVMVDTCIIHGTQDRMVPFDSGAMLSRRIPNARLVPLQGCGHFPMVETPLRVAREIDSTVSA